MSTPITFNNVEVWDKPKVKKHIFNAISLVTLMYFTGCMDDLCSSQIIQEKTNGSKTHKLIYFDRDCGATTGNSNQLSVVSIDEVLDDDGGNIFVASSNSGNNSDIDRGVVAEWLDESTISVEYAKELTVFKKVNKVGSIHIIYKNMAEHQKNRVNNQDIRIQVLAKNKIGRKYTFKAEDQTTTHLTYLGVLITNKGIQYKIINSVWIWGRQAHRATSRILVFNSSNKYLGNFSLTVIDDLPGYIRNNCLVFTNPIGSDCDPQTMTSLNFKDGIPKDFFRKCNGDEGNIYTFDAE